MSDKELVDKIVMFRTELERQNAGMGIMSLFDTICSYYGEQHRAIKGHLTTIESQKEEIEKLNYLVDELNKSNKAVNNMLDRAQITNKSLVAITELADKGLKYTASGVEWSHVLARKAKAVLDEIERLQNGTS